VPVTGWLRLFVSHLLIKVKVEVKVWTLSSSTYMTQTHDQQRFTISEVAVDCSKFVNEDVKLRLFESFSLPLMA